ncbi:MAG: sigma-54 dependent transcriptional regulator [Desulfobacterota bacterium]|nr:sigma-54 dependent transcriptional regulator [Thermodesulfobacteriota bacterium]
MEKILIVDDEEGMRIALSEALKRSGFETLCCSDGIEAVANLKRSKFSMVITDVKMPKMDGIEVLREVKKISPTTPVVVVTAFGTVDNAVEAMKEGACDYLLKPFSFENLIEIVKNGLAQADLVSGKTKTDNLKITYKSAHERRELITADPEMQRIITMSREIAASSATVLITGESGTGKELIARLIHECSPRADRPFVAVNCAAIPDNLLESELFGHEKGSFTGAAFRKFGKFELAQGGTILLDEIGEMSLTLQAKLLRVLQEFEIDRIGGKEPIPIDVRVVSTTNLDLKKAIAEGKFREDLFYRLNVIPIKLPPLRERKGDIPILIDHFLKLFSDKHGRTVKKISNDALDMLISRPWNGNVRELQNTIERAVLLCTNGIIKKEHCILEDQEQSSIRFDNFPTMKIEEMERRLITKALEETHGNRTHAARALGISIRTLRNKLKEYKEKNLAFESI